MAAYLIYLTLLGAFGVAAGAFMHRRRERFGTWAALGAAMGPFVIPYARLHLRDRPDIDLRSHLDRGQRPREAERCRSQRPAIPRPSAVTG